jgi:hypothetical protein
MQATCAALVVALLPRVALIIERASLLERVVEIGEDPARADPDPYITVLVHVQDLPAEEVARLLEPVNGEGCDCAVFAPTDPLIITDLRSKIERLLRGLLRLTLTPAPRPAGSGSG